MRNREIAHNFSWSGVLYGTGDHITGQLYYSGGLHVDVTDGSDQTAYSDLYITVTDQALRCIR